MKKRYVLLFIALVIFSLLCLEILLRILEPNAFFATLIQSHPYYNHTFRPNCIGKVIVGPMKYKFRCKTNSLGLFQPEEVVIPKPDNLYRILIIGDSFVAGLRRPFQIPFLLNKKLNEFVTVSGKIIEVVNCGQSSYSPLLYLARLKKQYINLSPDAIIIMPDITDIYDDNIRYKDLIKKDTHGNIIGVAPSKRLLEYEKLYITAHFYSTNSYLIRIIIKKFFVKLLNKKISKRNKNEKKYMSIKEINYTVSNIKKIIHFAKLHDVHISIAMYPHLFQIFPEEKTWLVSVFENKIKNTFTKETELLCKKESIPFKNFHNEIANSVFAGDKLFLDNDMHFNERGLKLLSDNVINWILERPLDVIGIDLIEKHIKKAKK